MLQLGYIFLMSMSRGLKFIFEFNIYFFNIERCPILPTCALWMILRDLALPLCYEVCMLRSRHNYITHNSRGHQSGIQAPPARAVWVSCWSDGFTCEKWHTWTDLPYIPHEFKPKLICWYSFSDNESAENDFFVAFYSLADLHWCWVCTLPGNNLRIPVRR